MNPDKECGGSTTSEVQPGFEEKDEGPETNHHHFTSIPHGFQQSYHYTHGKKQTELVDVTVNTRTKQFILLDSRGITTWTKDAISNAVSRSLKFPKYHNHLLRNIIFAKKFNVYFCLAHDFSLKVLNKDFEETCTADSDLSSVMFMVFNPSRDELITGGVKGTKIWEFRQIADRIWKEIRPMANYGLFLKKQLDSVGGAWVRKLELNEKLQHLYCCSDIDISCYNMDGKFLFKIPRAHCSHITGCKYSPESKMLVTGSFDCEVKVWSLTGGLVHTFRGHSRAVTNIILHPETSSLVLSSSLDGTVRMWSLDIMEEMYCIVISSECIVWMGLLADRSLWTATTREIFIWNIDQTVQFYSLVRSRVTIIQVAQCAGKTSRVLAVGEDSSVRLVSMRDRRNLSTVLPPPSLSPLQQVLAVSYIRECNLVYLLINPQEIWVYTMRTDPACRTAVWDVSRIQDRFGRTQSPVSTRSTVSIGDSHQGPIRSTLTNYQIGRATAHGKGPCPSSPCTALTTVSTHIVYWTKEDPVSPIHNNFLVLGLQDGRMVFLDPVRYGCRYCELQACKNAIIDLQYDSTNSLLIARSHLREDDMFQIWSLPELDLKHEILAQRDVTCYAYSIETFMMGHVDGLVAVHKFTPGNPLGVPCNPPDDEGHVDHLAPVLAVDSCTELGIFATCSEDGVIKIWDLDKILCAEIVVEDTLTCARFLNQQGDLLIGYKNHLFCIHHSKVLASFSKDGSSRQDLFETESEIYEDPAVRYEGAAANPDPLSMETYLVPFDLDFSEGFLGGEDSPQLSQHSSEKADDSDSDSDYSMAPTDLYLSPSSTPRRLSYIDLILPGDCITSDTLRNQSVTIISKKKGYPLLEIVKPEKPSQSMDDFSMPQFGTSPGPSPTPSPPSTPSDFNLSERESESDLEVEKTADEVKGQEEKEMGREALVVEKTIIVMTKDIPKQDTSTKPTSTKETQPRPRFGMSSVRIDADTLIKSSKQSLAMSSARPTTALSAKVSSLDNTSKGQESIDADSSGRKISSSKKKIEKKKKQRGGDRQKIKPTTTKEEEEKETSMPGKSPQETDGSTKSFQKNVHTMNKSKTLSKSDENSPHAASSAKQSSSKAISQPSIKNLPMDKDTNREPYKASASKDGVGTEEKHRKKRKKSSIFSKYKKPQRALGGISSVDGASENEDLQDTGSSSKDSVKETSGPSMYKAASRAAIVQKYNPLAGSRKDLDAPVPTSEQSLPTSSEVSVSKQGAIPSQEHPPSQDHLLTLDHQPSTMKPSQVSTALRRVSRSDESADDTVDDTEAEFIPTHPNSSKASLYLEGEITSNEGNTQISQSAIGGPAKESNTDLSVSYSGRDLDTAMGSLSIGTMSRPSTAASFRDATRSLLSYYEDRSSFAMSRPPSVTSGTGPAAPSSELEEIAQLKKSLIMRSNNVEGSLARPNTAKGERTTVRYPGDRRPHTAGENMHVTFLDKFQGSKKLANGPRPDGEQFRLYTSPSPKVFKYHKNDGLNLEVDWQDKMIERHKLMKVQKELRSRSAAEKRQLLDIRRRQKRSALTGHRDCVHDQGNLDCSGCKPFGFPTQSEPFNDMRRSRSAPPMSHVPELSRPSSQMMRNTPSPVQSRKRDQHSAIPKPKIVTESYKEDNFKSEVPYRFRLSSHEACSDQERDMKKSVRAAGTPPTRRVHHPVPRPHTSKSIPSKARRYILIPTGRSESQMTQVTPLEVQLLGERFPKSKEYYRSRTDLLHSSHSISGHKVIPTMPDQKAVIT